MRRFKWVLLLMLSLVVGPVIAQGACPAIVQDVLANLETTCSGAGRNEACYGNIAVLASAQPDVTEFNFESIGDIEGVSKIQSIRMAALNEDANAWGVALMRVQANLPDTLPGENVTFILFGDVELVNAVDPNDPNARPMQAFYLRTGIGDAACAEAPESGLMVRTPEGRGEVSFAVNGVNVTMGSDIFMQSQPGGNFSARTFGGTFSVELPDGSMGGGIAGTQVNIPMGPDNQPAGPPDLTSYDPGNTNLPPDLFGEVAPPLAEEEVEFVNLVVQNGGTPCGTAPFLPACDEVISNLGGTKCPVNDAGEEDCSIVPGVNWTDFNPPTYDDVSVWNIDPLTGEETEGTPTPAGEDELPPGCEPGICLQDPAEACQCALCGVACPVATPTPAESEVDCAVTPDNPACQQNPGGDGGQPPPSNGGSGGGDPQPPDTSGGPGENPTPDAGGCGPGEIETPGGGCTTLPGG